MAVEKRLPSHLVAILPSNTVEYLRPLTAGERRGTARAFEQLAEVQHTNDIYGVCMGNLDEFFEWAIDFVARCATNEPPLQGEANGLVTVSNRLLLNYLTTFRLYLEHVEGALKRGSTEEDAAAFAAVCAREYDACFEYRLAYRLRNFAVHRGFPIHTTNLHLTKKTLSGPSTVSMKVPGREVGLFLALNRDYLLKDDCWRSMKKEISSLDDFIDVGPVIRRSANSLSRIHEFVFALLAREHQAVVRLLCSLEDEVKALRPGAQTAVGTHTKPTEEGITAHFSSFPQPLLTQLARACGPQADRP